MEAIDLRGFPGGLCSRNLCRPRPETCCKCPSVRSALDPGQASPCRTITVGDNRQLDGEPLFAELAILELLNRAGSTSGLTRIDISFGTVCRRPGRLRVNCLSCSQRALTRFASPTRVAATDVGTSSLGEAPICCSQNQRGAGAIVSQSVRLADRRPEYPCATRLLPRSRMGSGVDDAPYLGDAEV